MLLRCTAARMTYQGVFWQLHRYSGRAGSAVGTSDAGHCYPYIFWSAQYLGSSCYQALALGSGSVYSSGLCSTTGSVGKCVSTYAFSVRLQSLWIQHSVKYALLSLFCRILSVRYGVSSLFIEAYELFTLCLTLLFAGFSHYTAVHASYCCRFTVATSYKQPPFSLLGLSQQLCIFVAFDTI